MSELDLDAIEQREDAVSVPRWIPVTERLPEVGGYLVSILGVSTDCAIRTPLGWMLYGETSPTARVTHWMPLPPSPQEEK